MYFIITDLWIFQFISLMVVYLSVDTGKNHIENPNLNDSLKNSLTEDLNYFNPSKDTNTDELLSYIENIDTDKVDHNCFNKIENEIKYKSRNEYLNSDNYYLNTFSQSCSWLYLLVTEVLGSSPILVVPTS